MTPRIPRLRGVVLALALIVPAVPLFAASASSAAQTFTLPAGASTYAHVHASNGYRLNFSENDRHYFAARVVGQDATTTFGLRGRPVTGDRVSANLGRRGRFDLRFVPVGRPENVPVFGFCTGAVGHWQAGYLVGHFHFRAEGGYTGVSLGKVPAARETWSRRRCHFSEALLEEHPKLRRMRLSASARAGGKHEALEAILFHRHARPPGRRVRFRAFRREREGRISIEREVKVEAPETSFASVGGPKMPEEIEVKPPAPFVGSATFTRTAESTFEWSGDLAVTFPGLPPVRLAGPKFSASVCAGNRCVTKPSKATEKLLGELFAGPARGR
jgi:hypothetical protein